MGKRKLKILLHRVRETKELWMVLHIKVYRKEERNFTAVHLFNGAKFVWFWLLLPLIRCVFVCKIWLELFCFWRGITLGFTASWRAVLRAWLFVYPTPASSAFSLPRHRLYARCPLRSCALLSGSDCRWFFQACSCNPAGLNSQCHRQSRTPILLQMGYEWGIIPVIWHFRKILEPAKPHKYWICKNLLKILALTYRLC